MVYLLLMKKNKVPVTLKVIIGYLLIIALALYSIWFVYEQIETLSKNAKEGGENSSRLILMSEIASNLFIAEGISRDIIQNQKNDEFPRFEKQIDTVNIIIYELKDIYEGEEIKRELDSFNSLLGQKTLNLKELLELRENATTESYYSKVIRQLQRIDYSFEDENYEWQLRNHDPSVRRAIIGLIEYSKENRANELTQKTSDSLINSLKKVLNSLERQERRIMQSINEKENELLENDRVISNQLQVIRSKIEQEEILIGLSQVNKSQDLLQKSSTTVSILGIISVITMLVFVTLIFYDTNKSQKYRKELENAKNISESLLKSREQIMATVTHDLRSPLNNVIGYSSLLENTPLNFQQSQYLKNLKYSSDYILKLVNELLDLSKLEAGKMQVEKMRFNLVDLINNTLKSVIPENDSKKIKITTNISNDFNTDIISDTFRIQQVLTNLITNAYKFTKKGSITIEATYKSSGKTPVLIIKIIDTGIGIPKEIQAEVFQEFSQFNQNNNNRNTGFGLGLAISKKIVTLLGGNIYLDSEEEKGTAFTVEIPFEFAEPTSENTVISTEKAIPKVSKNKVLVIDDDISQLTLTTEVLKLTGITIESSSDPKEALDKIKTTLYDMIITDIQMPEMDGFEILREVKKITSYQQVPVIAISGKTDVTHDHFLNFGFSEHLTKPYKPEALYEVIKKYFEIEQTPIKPILADFHKTEELYNLSDIYLFTEGDQQSLRLILSTFIENTKENMVEISSHLSEKNLDKIGTIAHKMLPMFRQMRIENAIPILEKMELKEIPIDLLQLELEDLKTIVKKTLNLMKEEIRT